MVVVTDNGPCFKNRVFERFIDSRREPSHVRTHRRSPQTNGVIERYCVAVEVEHL
jgi:transposase InsO family protein